MADIKKILMENGIEEEKATEIESAVKTDLHKDFIPKEQYNKKVQHITELEEKLQEAGKDSVDVQDYKQQIKALEDKYNSYKAEIEAGAEKRNKQEIIKSELHKQGLHSSIIELLDYDVNNFEFNEGAVAGDSWDAYSSGLKEKYKDFVIEIGDQILENKKISEQKPANFDVKKQAVLKFKRDEPLPVGKYKLRFTKLLTQQYGDIPFAMKERIRE